MFNLLLMANQQFSDHPLQMFIFFAPAWAAFQAQWQGFFISNAILLVTIFWFSDVLLGASKAIYDNNFQPGKFVKGVTRWLVWVLALAVAWGFRIGLPGVGNIVASIVESVIILAEGSSILRNLALFSGEERVQKLLNVFADKLDDKIDDIVDTLDKEEEKKDAD